MAIIGNLEGTFLPSGMAQRLDAVAAVGSGPDSDSQLLEADADNLILS